MPHDRDTLYDILDSARRIAAYLEGFDFERFEGDPAIQDAVIRRFEVIGEATKRLSADLRAVHPNVPWDDMAGMRDRVIHGYDTVDIQIVWKTAREDLPSLAVQLEHILGSID